MKTVIWSPQQPPAVGPMQYYRSGELALDDNTSKIVYRWELRAHQHTIFEILDLRKKVENDIEEVDREIDRLDHTGRDLEPLYRERQRLTKILKGGAHD